MKNKAANNIKLGVFVISGLLFLILTLYMIGKNRNLFGDTFELKAIVNNVNGLVAGNNVRYKGIDVGTVKRIELKNDSAIYITMLIDKKYKSLIKENAIASVGTDGLMGNRLVNINSQEGQAPLVKDGSVIQSRKAIETDEMLRTLNTTNNNMERITYNLREVTMKLNSSKSLWTLLSDTGITADLRTAVREFKIAGTNTKNLSYNAGKLVSRFEEGKGLAPTLFTDTTLVNNVEESLQKLKLASENTSVMMQNLEKVIQELKQGQGTAGLLLSDTTLRNALIRSAGNVEEGTFRFNQNMEAMQSNFLFRSYFKKQEKKSKKK